MSVNAMSYHPRSIGHLPQQVRDAWRGCCRAVPRLASFEASLARQPLRVPGRLNRSRLIGLRLRILSEAKRAIGQCESEFAHELQCSKPGIVGNADFELRRVPELQAFLSGEVLKRP